MSGDCFTILNRSSTCSDTFTRYTQFACVFIHFQQCALTFRQTDQNLDMLSNLKKINGYTTFC